MPIIYQMHQNLANMIAAGEVVNRPASVLKELIENAIDAQAKKIIIEIKDIGMSYLSVLDDGIGMDETDAKMASLRHATSKIKNESDLSHIQTLGFRGEALAAIASVSKVSLMTKQKDMPGTCVKVEAGKFISSSSISMTNGTKVEVESLFFNTPARFKYIKSEAAEKAALIDMFDRLALSHPDVAFKLIIDQQTIKETFGQQDNYALIDQIYGKNVTKDMIKIDEYFMKIHMKGFLITPKITRSRKKDVSVFINGRYIKNYALTQAIIEGYDGFIMVNRYPIALLYLEMDPSLIDVNVHPQKFEVKLVNESILSYQITQTVKKALLSHTHQITDVDTDQIKSTGLPFKITPMNFEEFLSIEEENHTRQTDQLTQNKIPDFDYVGTFAGTYLIFQNHQGLYLMDQHAAEERIRYEYYHEALKHPKHITKDLLISRPLSLTIADFEVIAKHQDVFHKYGFIFNKDLELTGIPMWLKDDQIDLSVETFTTLLKEEKTIDLSILRDYLAKDISCKGAIKANQSLNHQEIKKLKENLKACQNPYTCPHGRPTLIKLSHYEIEKLFKRVVS